MRRDPGYDRVQVVQSFGFRGDRPAHDDDLDSKRTSGFDLGVGRTPAAVLGHQRFDSLALHQGKFVGKRERTARQNELAVGEGVDLRRPVDRPHDVAMLRRSRESGELQPALREENRSRLSPKRVDSVVHGRNLDPAVTGLARPGQAGEHDDWRIGRAAGGQRIGRHARSERMGRVDDGADALGLKIGGQAVGAAEAADALRNGRPRGMSRGAGKRQDCGDIGLIGDPPRERARLRRAAENEQAKTLQCAAP